MIETIQTKRILRGSSEGKEQGFALTMTCSKRLHLFKKVLPSFKQYCEDSDLLSKIIIYDDNSSEEDRQQMEKIAEALFPNTDIIYRYFNNIHTKYHHVYIMQHWYEDIHDVDYVFHLEDDRIMTDYFSLFEMSEILKADDQLATVNIAQTKRDFPKEFIDQYGFEIEYSKHKDYWVWPYVKEKPCGEAMFYDTVRCEEGSKEFGFGYFEYFINYAGFGLQPCLMDCKKIRTIEKFRYAPSLEADFGKRYSEKYITVCYNKSKSIHIGSTFFQEQSAYEMNDTIR